MPDELQFPPDGRPLEAVSAQQSGHAPLSDAGSREDSDDRAGLPSASSMDRLIHCSGSRTMEMGLPPLPDQAVTSEGVNIHAALETGEDDNLEFSEKEIKARLEKMERDAVFDWKAEFNLAGDPQVIREQRFWARDRATLDPLYSSRPDVIYLIGDHALIVNYKTGYKNPTPSEMNWQSRTEVITFWHSHPSVTHIRGAIAASRLVSKFDATDYTIEDLKRIERDLRHAVWRSEQPYAPRVPGAWCRWCRAQGCCREAAVYGLIAQTRLPVDEGKPNQLALIDHVARMTPSEMAFVYQRRATMEVVFEAIKTRLLDLSDEDLAQIGYEKAKGNTTYPIENVPAAFAALQDLVGDRRSECIRIARGKVAELLAEQRKISKKEADEIVIETLGLQPKTGNPKLKPL